MCYNGTYVSNRDIGCNMEVIKSKENNTVKHIRSLYKRKYREKYGEYVVEGVRAVRDLLRKKKIHTICIAVSQVSSGAIIEIIEVANAHHCVVYLIEDRIFSTIEQTVQGQGILAIANKDEYTFHTVVPEKGIYLVLDRIQDPGNLGTIIRTAVSADVKGVILTKGSVDPYNEKCIRSTMSAISEIPIYDNIDEQEVIQFIQKFSLHSYVTALERAVTYDSLTYTLPAVLIMGNEANGVSQNLQDACDHRIVIPIIGNIESLNLAVATGICLYKMRESFYHETPKESI